MPKNIISWKIVLTGTGPRANDGRVEYCLGYAPDEPPENVRANPLSREKMDELLADIGPNTTLGQLHGILISKINTQEGM